MAESLQRTLPAVDAPHSVAVPPAAAPAFAPRGAAFVTREDRAREVERLNGTFFLVAQVGVRSLLGPSVRGRLAEALDQAIERELAARGAGGPGIASAGDRDAALSDQLYRARRVGAAGIALVIGPLAGAAGGGPAGTADNVSRAGAGALDPVDCATLRFLARAMVDRPLSLVLDASDEFTGGYGDPVPLAEVLSAQLPLPSVSGSSAQDVKAGDGAFSPTVEPVLPVPTDPLARHVAGASFVERADAEAWRNWTLQLAGARGPQPLATLERLFAESYMPLANAIVSGLDDPRAKAAHEEFRTTFTKSYTDAFPTFAATTKRPRMVLDAHEVAARIARLHGARSTRLLLVDGMRWDLGRLVSQRTGVKLGPRAALTDELLLWSALPTTTMRQLETIARGVEALRAPGELEDDVEPPRGRTAEYVRRIRVGPREIHKLDLVETRLQSARGGVMRALPEVAEATAEVIARHADTLGPHTLLFVFGDHGFAIDRSGSARQGGASPEEVLVGAFALLIGNTH